MDLSTEEILERTRQRKVRLDHELLSTPQAQTQPIKRKSSADIKAADPENDTSADPPIKRGSFKAEKGDTESEKRRSLYPTQELNELKEAGDVKPSDVITIHTPSQYSRRPIHEISTPIIDLSNNNQALTRKERFQALAAHMDEFEVDMKHYTPKAPAVSKINSPLSKIGSPQSKIGSPQTSSAGTPKSNSDAFKFTEVRSSPAKLVEDRKVEDTVVQVTHRHEEKMEGKHTDIVDEVFAYAKTAIQGEGTVKSTRIGNVSEQVMPTPPPLPKATAVATPSASSGKVTSLASNWESRIEREKTVHTEINPVDPAEIGGRKAVFEIAAARAARGSNSNIKETPKATVPTEFKKVHEKAPVAPSAGFAAKPASRTHAPVLNTISSGIHWQPVDRVSPKKEVPQTKKLDMNALRNRWEVSSATGVPLHPDANADDLTKAAVAMAVDASKRAQEMKKQSSKGQGCRIEPVQEKVEPEHEVEEQSDEGMEVDEEESSESEKVDEVTEESSGQDDSTSDSVFGAVIDECLDQMLSSESADSSLEPEVQQPQALPDPPASAPPVMHSVSFYRTMQRQTRTPGKEHTLIIKPPTSPSKSGSSGSERSPDKRVRKELQMAYDKKQKVLKEAVNVQQEHIVQSSRALNLCKTTAEFRGSREEVDAQRALLLATERRRALLRESDRIHQCQNQKTRIESEGPHGTLTISAISCQLKREFVNDNFNRVAGDLLFYFICLLKHRENVICTQMVNSDDAMRNDGKLEFPNYLQLNNLPHDFVVKLEIYSLRAKREAIAHEEKYRINGNTLKSKGKSSRSSLFSPGVSSPGGPLAVLDPSFQLLGSMDLNLSRVNQQKFRLEGVQFSAPIEGTLAVRLRCCAHDAGAVTQEGFLSLYEEISGYGSWTRLWCTLKDGLMKFWRYPDEEHTKEPLAIVDLSRSLTTSVEAMSREKCIRPHTFKVDIAPEGTPVPSTRKKPQYVRFMLSSDTKEDCHVWCNKVNGTLRNVRMWNPDIQE